MIDEVINKAREMRAKFLENCQGNRQPIALNTEKFMRIVGKATDTKIEAVQVKDMGALRGLFARRRDGSIFIAISDTNNECWRRFTHIKELSHIFIEGDDREMSADAFEQATALVDRGDVVPYDNSRYQREVNAVIAAIEIMIPQEFRNYISHKVLVDKESAYLIATQLKVPQKYVEYRLRQWKLPIQNTR